MAVALGHLAAQHRAGRAIDARDLFLDLDRHAGLERRHRLRDELAVEDVDDRVILRLAVRDGDTLIGLRLVEEPGEVEALALPVLDRVALVEHLHLPDHLLEAPIAH
jgi:hypothetical protein